MLLLLIVLLLMLLVLLLMLLVLLLRRLIVLQKCQPFYVLQQTEVRIEKSPLIFTRRNGFTNLVS